MESFRNGMTLLSRDTLPASLVTPMPGIVMTWCWQRGWQPLAILAMPGLDPPWRFCVRRSGRPEFALAAGLAAALRALEHQEPEPKAQDKARSGKRAARD